MSFADFGKPTAVSNPTVSDGGFSNFGKPTTAITPQKTGTLDSIGQFFGVNNASSYIPDFIQQSKDFFKNPGQSIKNIGSAAVDAIVQPIKNVATNFKNLFSSEQETPAERTANALHTGASIASVIFSPINAVFDAAEKFPPLKPAADLLQAPFAALGHVGEFAGDKFVDVLPIDQASKDVLKPAFGEVGALAAQILLGGKTMDFIVKGGKIDKTTVKNLVDEAKTQAETAKADLVQNHAEFSKYKLPEEKAAPSAIIDEVPQYKNAKDFIKKKELDLNSVVIKNAKKFIVENSAGNDAVLREVPIVDFGKPKFTTLNQKKYEAGRKITDPIEATLVDGKYKITDGANRFTQAVANGDKTIPVVLEVRQKGKVLSAKEIADFYAPKGEKSGIAKNIEAQAIERGLTKNGFDDLAEYTSANKADQAKKVADLMNNDLETAKKIIRGEVKPPKDLRTEVLFSAMDQYANKVGDAELARDLARSPIASQVSAAASKLSLFEGTVQDSASSAIKDIENTRKKAAENRNVKKEKKNIATEIKKEIEKAAPKKAEWSDFIESLKC